MLRTGSGVRTYVSVGAPITVSAPVGHLPAVRSLLRHGRRLATVRNNNCRDTVGLRSVVIGVSSSGFRSRP
ncbi:hypothetical protein RHRU231_660005 [Rhodococcus ruber]|uniref:Uncharacterized protein n=1 Tax=Rhodococcus ruber TaxID=1830 RepID=A0A098BN63_9NOCA|nr:hypothetical protein RHRU231_660005 [Rhodococcus ruber]